MSSESVCQVARRWVDVGSFYTSLFGVVYVTCGDFHAGSDKGTASSPTSFWRKTKLLLSSTHHTPLIWHPVTSSYFQNWNWSWKDFGLIPLMRSRTNHRKCLTLTEKDFQEVFQSGKFWINPCTALMGTHHKPGYHNLEDMFSRIFGVKIFENH